MDNIRPIKNESDLAWALQEIEPYFLIEPKPQTVEADRFDILSDLIEAYENRQFSIGDQNPVEFLRNYMTLTDRSQSDLAQLFGSRSRASEILNKKRALTVEMIHRLHVEWGIPAECLIRPYNLAAA
jgi:HTH-type transcriptional regulator / antitoxin HigA